MATILRFYDIDATELELARECHTYRGGTECWYIARALRRRGLRVRFVIDKTGERPTGIPCIAGVLVGGAGHFVALLPQGAGEQAVADPMYGVSKPRATEHEFTGFYMLVSQSQ
jgi:ABC-type bacteriocin/lantibiotic exporter with double-glycine peptidase domain